MHPSAMENFKRNWVAAGLLAPRTNLRILDMGGQDINGTVHNWIKTGGDTLDVLDIEQGPGVTIVGDARKTDWWDGQHYDVVISTEMLEHLDRWYYSLDTAERVLRPGGWFVGTCASTGRQRHGATGAPEPAPGEYYENVSASELIDSLRFRRFAEVQVGYELLADTPTTHDLHWRARKVGA
jgi:hypothetical protein